MRRLGVLFCALLLCESARPVLISHTQARLILAADSARPGDTVLAGIQLKMDPGWHTYWKNPGDSGEATKIQWQLPEGVTAGDTQWPYPKKLPDPGVTTYIYDNEVVLLTPLRLASNLPAGPLLLKAKVSWLECEQQCVPNGNTVTAKLEVGAEAKPAKDAALLEAWQKKIPQPDPAISARASWEPAMKPDLRPLDLEWSTRTPADNADFFPDSSQHFEVQSATERLPDGAGMIHLRKQVKKFDGGWPARISGVLIQNSGAVTQACEVDLAVANGDSTAPPNLSTASPPARASGSLLINLFYAFIGGMILNIMPCVLPVISLKILGFVGQAKSDPRQVRKLGLIYGLGVLVSFLALAGVVIGLKAAGQRAGWGIQFSNPEFVVVLTVVVTLVALNLFGLFEVNPGTRVLDTAGTLASKHGAGGAFFNGMLATVLATPCTAWLLADAVGFTSTHGAPTVLLIFVTIGCGLALPYVLLSWQPVWLKFLPKPGAWMDKFKIAMGFPMLATAFWLFSLVPIYYGDRGWWLGIFLVVVALAAWVFGEFGQRGGSRRGLATVIALGLLVAGYAFVVEGRLRWRKPIDAATAANTAPEHEPDGVAWQPWSQAAVAAGRAAGRPVLVDFTAKWCFNCNVLVKPVLESQTVRDEIRKVNALPLLGDYTRYPGDIKDELTSLGRDGVPLVLVYSKNPQNPPEVFNTVTRGTVVSALERAAR